MMVEDFLQDCQTHQNLRAETWPADTLVGQKLYRPSPVKNLQHIMAYVQTTGAPMWASDDEKEEHVYVHACTHMWVDVNSKFHF